MLKKILVVVILFLLVAFIAKDKIIEVSSENIFKHILGIRLDIGSMDVGLVRPAIFIKDMKLYNPRGFPTETMAVIPEVYVRYDLIQVLKGKVYLEELKFSMQQLNIVRDEQARLNVNTIKPLESKEEGQVVAQQEQRKIPEIYIANLHLKVGDVYYRDYSARSEQPTVKKYEINLDEEYQDIKDPYTLVRLIFVRSLTGTDISNLVDIPMSQVQDVMQKAYSTGKEAIGAAAEQTSETTHTVIDKTSSVLKEAAEGFGGLLNGQGRETDQ
ncbi:MAG: hypothetical protein GF409_05870 [Candidatus Omnitrophica bacterium]|nr:hypothetical protein [Candidatus Omnitrophota bacterium]